MKIEKQYNKSIEQKNNIANQENINKENIDNISISNLINQYIKKIENLNNDWDVLNHLTEEIFFPPNSVRIISEILAYEWVINLDFLPSILIPYLNIQILYKSPENVFQRAIDEDLISFKTAYNIQSEESIDDNPNKITLIANIFVRQRMETGNIIPLDIEDIEAKLLVTLQQPNNYV